MLSGKVQRWEQLTGGSEVSALVVLSEEAEGEIVGNHYRFTKEGAATAVTSKQDW